MNVFCRNVLVNQCRNIQNGGNVAITEDGRCGYPRYLIEQLAERFDNRLLIAEDSPDYHANPILTMTHDNDIATFFGLGIKPKNSGQMQ